MSAQLDLGDIDLDDLLNASCLSSEDIGLVDVDADRSIMTNSTSASVSIPKAADLGLVGNIDRTAHMTVWEVSDRYVVVGQIPKKSDLI